MRRPWPFSWEWSWTRSSKVCGHHRLFRGGWRSIDQGQPFRVVVDFAHNPASLRSALEAGRLLCRESGRVICVLGFSGGGDAAKRPIMRDIAVERSDVLLLTVNNPRRRSPDEILGEVSADALENEGVLLAFVDRAEAIVYSIRMAEAGDVVLIVGRGCQTHQIVGKERRPFDDREVARDCLSAIGHRRYSRRAFGARLVGRPASRQQAE